MSTMERRTGYKLRHKYQTAHKYPGIDNWEQAPEVLERERGKIIEMLGHSKRVPLGSVDH